MPRWLATRETSADGQVSVVCQEVLIPGSPRQRDKVSVACQVDSRGSPVRYQDGARWGVRYRKLKVRGVLRG